VIAVFVGGTSRISLSLHPDVSADTCCMPHAVEEKALVRATSDRGDSAEREREIEKERGID